MSKELDNPWETLGKFINWVNELHEEIDGLRGQLKEARHAAQCLSDWQPDEAYEKARKKWSWLRPPSKGREKQQ